MRKTFLLGIIKNRIITGEIEITTRNGYEEFTACFNEGEAFKIDEINDDYKMDYYNEVWDCYDANGKLDLLQDGEKTKEEVFSDWSYNDDYNIIVDCSCTNYEIEKDGETINFETIGAGQHDCRKDKDFGKMIFTNKKAFKMLMDLWDCKHLKEINGEDKKKIEEVEKLLANYEEYNDIGKDNFYSFIQNNIEV